MVSAFLSYMFGLLFLPNNPKKVCLKGMRLKKEEDKYQEEKDPPVKTPMSLPMLVMQSRGKKVSGVSHTRHGSISCGRERRSDLRVKADVEALDEADKEAEKSTLIRKPHIAFITGRWVWETRTKSLMKKRRRKNPHRRELNQSIPSMLRWLYLDCNIMTARSKTTEHHGVTVSLPEQCQRVQSVFCRMPTGSYCVRQSSNLK